MKYFLFLFQKIFITKLIDFHEMEKLCQHDVRQISPEKFKNIKKGQKKS